MKVLVQWAFADPKDWQIIDSTEWGGLPKGPVPSGHDIIDNARRWIHSINVQGVIFNAYDHYAVEDITDDIIVTVWNDDPEDWQGKFIAYSWSLRTPAYDPKVGQINTRQSYTVYTQKPVINVDICKNIYSWDLFIPPPEFITRHGIWVPDELNKQHIDVQSQHGWEEWV